MDHKIKISTEDAHLLTGYIDFVIRAQGLQVATEALRLANLIGTQVTADLEDVEDDNE